MKTLVLCSDAPYGKNGGAFRLSRSDSFGNGWIPLLASALPEGWTCLTGDEAILSVRKGGTRPSDVLLISEMDSADAKILIQYGCTPFLIYCFESPIYAPSFYENIKELVRRYRYYILFNNTIENELEQRSYKILTGFPSFVASDFRPIKEYNSKKNIVIINSNKFVNVNWCWRYIFEPANMYEWAKLLIKKSRSAVLKQALKKEIQTERLRCIEFLGNLGVLDVFGGNWDREKRFPPSWRRRMKSVSSCFQGICADKAECLSNYRFALCFENVRMKGYITEKIIHSIVAGAVPIYLGAPDVVSYVPPESFIDYASFGSPEALWNFVSALDNTRVEAMAQAGRDFLLSERGAFFSCERLARDIHFLIEEGLSGVEE